MLLSLTPVVGPSASASRTRPRRRRPQSSEVPSNRTNYHDVIRGERPEGTLWVFSVSRTPPTEEEVPSTVADEDDGPHAGVPVSYVPVPRPLLDSEGTRPCFRRSPGPWVDPWSTTDRTGRTAAAPRVPPLGLRTERDPGFPRSSVADEGVRGGLGTVVPVPRRPPRPPVHPRDPGELVPKAPRHVLLLEPRLGGVRPIACRGSFTRVYLNRLS